MAAAGITDTSEVSGSGSSVGQTTAPRDIGKPSPATFLNDLMSERPGLVLRFTSTGSRTPSLEQFAYDERLQHRTRHRPIHQRLRRIPAEQVAAKTGVGEIQLRGLHYARGDISGIRLEKVDEVGRLKDAEPVLRCGHRNSDVPRQIGKVEQLTGARRNGPDELEEALLVGDLRKVANVTLDVGADIGAEEPFQVLDLSGNKRRIAAAMNSRKKLRHPGEASRSRHGRGGGKDAVIAPSQLFALRYATQLQNRDPAGKGLAYVAHQVELLRTRQPEHAVLSAGLVNHGLNGGQQLRRILNFIYDNRGRICRQKRLGVAPRKIANGQFVE